MATPDEAARRRAVLARQRMAYEEKMAVQQCSENMVAHTLKNIIPAMEKASEAGEMKAHIYLNGGWRCPWEVRREHLGVLHREVKDAAQAFLERKHMTKVHLTVERDLAALHVVLSFADSE